MFLTLRKIEAPCPQPPLRSIITNAGDCAAGPSGYECTINADMMQLYYWPVTRENYDVCDKTGTTVTSNYPTTAMVGSVTITSPSVALSMPAILAYDRCGLLGSRMENVVVSFPASQLSSGNGNGMHAITHLQSFDYGHLPPNRIPVSAWLSQPTCNCRLFGCSQQTSLVASGRLLLQASTPVVVPSGKRTMCHNWQHPPSSASTTWIRVGGEVK